MQDFLGGIETGGASDALRGPRKRHRSSSSHRRRRKSCPSPTQLLYSTIEDEEDGIDIDDVFYIDYTVIRIGDLQKFTVHVSGANIRDKLERLNGGEAGVRIKSRGMLSDVICKVHPLIKGWLVGKSPETVTATVLTFARQAFPKVMAKMPGALAAGKDTRTRKFSAQTLKAWETFTADALKQSPMYRVRVDDQRLEASQAAQKEKSVQAWRSERKGSRRTSQWYGDLLMGESSALFDIHAKNGTQANAVRQHALVSAKDGQSRAHRQTMPNYGTTRRTYTSEPKTRANQSVKLAEHGLSENAGSKKLVRLDKRGLPPGAPAIGKHESVSTIEYTEVAAPAMSVRASMTLKAAFDARVALISSPVPAKEACVGRMVAPMSLAPVDVSEVVPAVTVRPPAVMVWPPLLMVRPVPIHAFLVMPMPPSVLIAPSVPLVVSVVVDTTKLPALMV